MAEFSYHYGLKMRIYPSTRQKQIIKLNSDIARTVYNKLIAIDKELCQLSSVKLPIDSINERIDELKQRKVHKYLINHFQYMQNKDIDSLSINAAIRNYKKAWDMYKKVNNIGIPKFHKKGYTEKYQTRAQYGKNSEMDIFSPKSGPKFLDMKHVYLPKLGRIRISGFHRRLLDRKKDIKIGTVTVSKSVDDKYFVSMQLGSDTPFVEQKQPTGSQIGVDLNTDNFLTTSDGTQVANPRYYRTIKGKLAKAQRKLSRRQLRAKKERRNLRDAKNYQKQRLVVAKLQAKVRRQRNNFLHKISITLINNHDLVVAENLRSKNMLKNHALAMSIVDVGWRTFLQMMEYKANLYGRTFVTVDPKNTTQMCSDCGFIMGQNGSNKLMLKDREWICPHCNVHHIRDHNAAKNILNKGLLQIA